MLGPHPGPGSGPDASADELVGRVTRLGALPFLPELRVHLAEDDVVRLWERTEEWAGSAGQPPPFWAFAWAGGQALARYLLDHPDQVAGRRVLDVGCGAGVVAIAAARAGASSVTAVDVDPLAVAATRCNAAANGVSINARLQDVLDGDGAGAEVIVIGDLLYERELAVRVLAFLGRATARGARALVGDPGRAYLPRTGLEQVAGYDVPVDEDLEGRPWRHTRVLVVVDAGPGDPDRAAAGPAEPATPAPRRLGAPVSSDLPPDPRVG